MLQLEATADGSYTLYVPEMQEHYHSIKGALTESMHIFIEMGVRHCTVPSPRILEIGFGTGLNAFLTLLESEQNKREISYTSLELFPIDPKIIQRLRYPESISPEHKDLYYKLHSAEWGKSIPITSSFTLRKILADFTQYSIKETYDIIYFDAFAPEKQPEMWNQKLFDKLYSALNANGILTTYCAKGTVRRMLKTCGFYVERLPGPPKGKREILRATKTF